MTAATSLKGRIAWCVSPHLSGVGTVYRVVGGGLRRLGWEVHGVTQGAQGAREFDPRLADEFCEVLAPESRDVLECAAEFVRWVMEREIDIVVCHGQMATLAAAPALPVRTRLVTRSASIARRSYELATANLDRTSVVLVETPRQRQDLARDWGVPAEKCAFIPGGVELEMYSPGGLREFDGALRLVFLGRLEEQAKAVSMLPRIVGRLAKSRIEFRLDIIGEGPEREHLQNAFGRAGLAGRVTFHGYLPRAQSVPILQQGHVFLLTSRYEGHSWALLEAMACGCVPVVSRIAGGTDFVVEQGKNGILCAVGKPAEFTTAIAHLAGDRKRLEAMSAAAGRAIRERFSLERVVQDHDSLFAGLLARPPLEFRPAPLSAIQPPRLSGARWRRWVPRRMKNLVRTWAERFHRTV